MTRGLRVALAALSVAAAGQAAGRATPRPDDTAQPPARLAETGLYAPGASGVIDARNRPFSPQYPLWTDGASKRRWVYLPPGAAIDAAKDERWEFPVGTRFWKEFAFHGRRVETRLLWKASPSRWVTASYVWNEEGTDAMLAPGEGVRDIVEIAPGRRHSVPGRADCAACHGERTEPLGFNPLQLSTDRDPRAIHGEPLSPGMVTLKTLQEDGLLSPSRPDYVERPPRVATASPLTRTALGYLSANCGGCHNGRGEISVASLSVHYADLLRDGDAAARRLVRRPTRWQAPGRPEGTSVVIHPESPGLSALLVRMRSRRPSSQMPPLGTAMRDEAALEVLARWIEQDLRRPRQPTPAAK